MSILVTAAGGAPAINFVRSLRLAPKKFDIVGADANKYYLQRSCADRNFLVPMASDPDFIPILNLLTIEEDIQFIYSQNDSEIPVISKNRDKLMARTYLPDHKTIEICQDKYASYQKWMEAGIKVPRTILIRNLEDLERAFRTLGPSIWVRETSGAFGKNSLPTSRLEQARQWIDFHEGWGHFSAAEYLSPNSTTWQSIWWHGELVVAQGRVRLYWEFANRSPSGVTGLTGTGVTITDPTVDEIAQRAILAIDPRPHGIFSVDLTYDAGGIPNPTEINIARFFTTHLFFSTAGLNMPYIYLQLALEGKAPPIPKKINPLPPDLAWIRGMDVEPVLTTVDEIDECEKGLHRMRERLAERSVP